MAESYLSQYIQAFISISYKIKVIIMLQNMPWYFLWVLNISFIVIFRVLATLRFYVKETVVGDRLAHDP